MTGTWTLQVVSGDVASLVANPSMVEAVQIAVATQVGVEPDMVQVTLSEGSAARRLRGVVAEAPAGAAARRRLAGTMVATYVITYPADEQGISDANGVTDALGDATEAQLTSALQSAIAAVPELLGDTFTLVVQAFDAPAIVIVPVSQAVSTTDPRKAASWALPRAAPFGMAARLAVAAAVLASSGALM